MKRRSDKIVIVKIGINMDMLIYLVLELFVNNKNMYLK